MVIFWGAVMSLGMSSIHDKPSPSIVSHDVWMESDDVRRLVLHSIAEHVITQHVDLATSLRPLP